MIIDNCQTKKLRLKRHEMKENEENYLITVIGFNYRTRKEASVFFFF